MAVTMMALDLWVSAPDQSDEDLDRMTRQLLRELKNFDLESVQLKSGDGVPAGAKGIGAATAGSIAISLAPALLPKLVEFLQAWILQGRGRTIKFKGMIAGQNIDFEGSFADMEKLIALLEEQQKG
jgi:hypothetical protein